MMVSSDLSSRSRSPSTGEDSPKRSRDWSEVNPRWENNRDELNLKKRRTYNSKRNRNRKRNDNRRNDDNFNNQVVTKSGGFSDRKADCCIFVLNVSFETTRKELRELFTAEVADVAFIEFFTDDQGKPKGTAIIEFLFPGVVPLAIEKMHRKDVKGRSIIVKSTEDAAKSGDFDFYIKADKEKEKPESDKNKTEMDRSKMEMGRSKMEMDRNKMEMDRSKMEMDRNKMEMDRSKMEMGRSKMEMDRNKMEINKSMMENDRNKEEKDRNREEMYRNKQTDRNKGNAKRNRRQRSPDANDNSFRRSLNEKSFLGSSNSVGGFNRWDGRTFNDGNIFESSNNRNGNPLENLLGSMLNRGGPAMGMSMNSGNFLEGSNRDVNSFKREGNAFGDSFNRDRGILGAGPFNRDRGILGADPFTSDRNSLEYSLNNDRNNLGGSFERERATLPRGENFLGKSTSVNDGSSSQWQYGNTYGLPVEYLTALGIDVPLGPRVFVSDLDPKVTDEDLRETFQLAGNVVDAEVLKNKSKQNRGMATVEYEHPLQAVQAISMLHNQVYFNRRISVRMDKLNDVLNKVGTSKLPKGLKSVGSGLGTGGKAVTDLSLLSKLDFEQVFNNKVDESYAGTSNINCIERGSNRPLNNTRMENFGGRGDFNMGWNRTLDNTGMENLGERGGYNMGGNQPLDNPMMENFEGRSGYNMRGNLSQDYPIMENFEGRSGYTMRGNQSQDNPIMENFGGRGSYNRGGTRPMDSAEIDNFGGFSKGNNQPRNSTGMETMGEIGGFNMRGNRQLDNTGSENFGGNRSLNNTGIENMGRNQPPNNAGMGGFNVGGNRSLDNSGMENIGDLVGYGLRRIISGLSMAGGLNKYGNIADRATQGNIMESENMNRNQSTSESGRGQTITINNLPVHYTSRELEELCKYYGNIDIASMVSQGTGKVKFISAEEAKRAADMLHNQKFVGRILSVSME